MIIKMSHKTKK